ncbi:MAG TPA: bifunctional hydroxymethylpyrimidine kinase/phosphomethylpyrimidine kinase [Pseudomonadales bacterium]|nr:bifunctional hydroxymethylpyrimidine kinase/phosphomethylpyrimidine kinase [Pseudomonadales bacterium]
MIKKFPIALTIAGSDSGGGAGIQADLKTFAAFGVHGTSAIACLTAQNPKRVLGIEPCPPKMLRAQLEAIFQELPPAAIKTGMLFSSKNIQAVAEFLKKQQRARVPLVVDPVLVSTSGAKLLQPAALKVLMDQLLPRATLVTPNLFEAEILATQKISSVEEMNAAARKIYSRWGCAVLLKGGHLHGKEATDIFFDGRTSVLLRAPFVKGIRTHGTGCVYSAAICASLAQGKSLRQAVQVGKRFITRAILRSYRIGSHFALGI